MSGLLSAIKAAKNLKKKALPPPPPPPSARSGQMDLLAQIAAGKKLKQVKKEEARKPPPMTSMLDAIKSGKVQLKSVSKDIEPKGVEPAAGGGIMGDLFAAIAKRRANIETVDNDSDSDDEWDDGEAYSTANSSSSNTIAASKHPDYKKFFDLITKGVPIGMVKLKAEQEGLNGEYLLDSERQIALD